MRGALLYALLVLCIFGIYHPMDTWDLVLDAITWTRHALVSYFHQS